MLWFDVERRYNSTRPDFLSNRPQLWFDVERRYNSTYVPINDKEFGCGLM